MIYRTGETITFVAYYTANGEAKTALSDVTGTIYKIGTSGSISAPASVEQGDGFYYKQFTPTENGIYVCIFKTADSTVDQKHIAGIAFRGVAGVNNLDNTVSSRADQTSADSIKNQTDKLQFDGSNDVKSIAQNTELTNLDDTVSSRLASADYTPPPSTADIDDQLTSLHGAGSWQSYAVNALLLTLTDDEITALLDSQSNKPMSVYRGDSLTVDITVLDTDSNLVDLTGATAKFTARTQENSSDSIIEKILDIYDPINGKMKLELTSVDTTINVKSYPSDIELTFIDGSVKTIWKSSLEIKWDVGR